VLSPPISSDRPDPVSDSALLTSLNPPQRDAVTRTEGPLLVIAGAGSGKTRVITHRIAYLIAENGVAPWEIFAATFTNKAAREMKSRVARLCTAHDTVQLSIATFHSQCAGILRKEGPAVGLSPHYTICDDTDQIALLRSCIEELGLDKNTLKPADVQAVISLAKMRLLEDAEAEKHILSLRSSQYADVYRLYQKRLRESDAADFDDLLLLGVKLWRENPVILEAYRRRYRYVLVDEYQDTNLAQFELVRLLAGQHHNLCVVGDEDQSIYSWRGAEITNLLDFQKHFPDARVIRLEQNYRSTKNILDAAHAVIVHNTQRLGKDLWTEKERGDPIVVIEGSTETAEARKIVEQILDLREGGLSLEEIALFYRTNALSRIYEEALREANVPYRVIGGVRFYDRKEIKDLLAYMQVIVNPGNQIALMRVINAPRRGIGKSALSNLVNYAREQNLAVFEVLLDREKLRMAGLKGKAAEGAAGFADLVVQWTAISTRISLRALAEDILKKTGYIESLGDPKSLEVLSRVENIQEFLGALDEFQEQRPQADLADYLETIALRGADEADKADGVSLMTVHNAKGLEFDVVFVVALEKDIFPNARAVREQMHNEEERRLFYVALTRARKRVYLTNAYVRRLYGRTENAYPSIFLGEIPKQLRARLEKAKLGPVIHEGKARHEGKSRHARTDEGSETKPLPHAAEDIPDDADEDLPF